MPRLLSHSSPLPRYYWLLAKEEWAIRIYLLQACLDLFLMEMRRIEELKSYSIATPRPSLAPHICRLGRCGHYPRLALIAWHRGANDERFVGEDVFILRRSMLWKHLTRRGGVLDQFDHPLLFARTGLKAARISSYGRSLVRSRLEGAHRDHFTPEEYDPQADEMDDFSDEDVDFDSDGSHGSQRDPVEVKVPRFARHHTRTGIVEAACNLLRAAPNVSNLSMSGYIRCSLRDRLPVFETLRSLCLPASLPFWYDPVMGGKHGPRMFELENLLVSGHALSAVEAKEIAGKGERFPRLRRFIWELVQTNDPCSE